MCVITKLIQYQFLINHAFLLFQAHSQLFSGGGGGGGGGLCIDLNKMVAITLCSQHQHVKPNFGST